MTRLRPVLMTSVATVCGHFPLTLVTGPGAKARNSIGLVLVAGMAVGTIFTLFFVPATTCSSPRTTARTRPSGSGGGRSRTVGLGRCSGVVGRTSQRYLLFGIEQNGRWSGSRNTECAGVVCGGKVAGYERKCEDSGAWKVAG